MAWDNAWDLEGGMPPPPHQPRVGARCSVSADSGVGFTGANANFLDAVGIH